MVQVNMPFEASEISFSRDDKTFLARAPQGQFIELAGFDTEKVYVKMSRQDIRTEVTITIVAIDGASGAGSTARYATAEEDGRDWFEIALGWSFPMLLTVVFIFCMAVVWL